MKTLILPFELKEPHVGLMRLSGLLRLQGDALVLEYQKTDNVLRVIKMEPQVVTIPLSDILFADAHSNIFKSYFHLRVSRFGLLNDLFDGGSGEVKLKIKRSNRDIAFDIADELRYRMNQQANNRLA